MQKRRKIRAKLGSFEKVVLDQGGELQWLTLERILRAKLEAGGAPECVNAAKEIVLALREKRKPDIKWDSDDSQARTINIALPTKSSTK